VLLNKEADTTITRPPVSPVLIWWILDAFFLHFSTITLYKPNVTMTSKKSISPLNTKWPTVCWYHV